MTKGKWRKKILAGFLGILALAALSGCQESLSDEFQEDQVIAEAKEMVERINAGELEGVWEDTFNVVMQNGTDPEELQENIDYYLKDKGEFQDFDKIQVRGITDRGADGAVQRPRCGQPDLSGPSGDDGRRPGGWLQPPDLLLLPHLGQAVPAL